MKFSLFLTSALFSVDVSAQVTVGIASGPTTGTNYPMVSDIVKVCSTPSTKLVNIQTAGGLENLDRIYGDKTTQYGIIPEDVLVYEQGNDSERMKKIVQIFPFFKTEIHLVVKETSQIKTLADLAGKNIVEGPDGSASWITTQVVKGLSGLKWTGQKLSQKDGINAVLSGSADASFITAGAPISILSETKGLRLIPIDHPNLDSFKYYTKARIPAGTYPNMPSTVSTYKVNNVLATYAFKTQYQKEIAELVGCIAKKVEYMQTTAGFHPKWRDVVPTSIESVAWPAHPAAVAAIKSIKK